MKHFTLKHTPAEIVTAFPKASDLFKSNEINFCCSGDIPLQQVFNEKHHLNGDEILSALNEQYVEWKAEGHKSMDWNHVALNEIVSMITEAFHGYLYDELPALSQFVTRVFERHGADQNHLKELYNLFGQFKVNIENQMFKKENEVFPLIDKYTNDSENEELLKLIFEAREQLKDEHKKCEDLLQKIRLITNDFVPPAYACNTYRVTYARLLELENNMLHHLHLENNILFAKVV